MWRPMFLVLVFCTLTFSKTLMEKGGKNIDWGKSTKLIDKIRGRALKCSEGKFVGQVDLFNIFEPLIEECLHGIDSQDKFIFAKAGICMMNTIGLMDEEGAPDTERMEAIYHVIYAPELLQYIPELPKAFHSCTKAYFDDYDNAVAIGKKEDIYESFMVYNNCIDTSTAKLLKIIEKVCTTL